MDIKAVDSSNWQISTLTELGLTNAQAKVFLTLAKSNQLTAQAIASQANISRPDVYRVINQLQQAGLIEIIVTKPEEFRAISTEECVSKLLEKQIQKTHDLKEKSKILIENLKKRNDPIENCEKYGFALIPSRGSVYSKSERLLGNTQKCICLLAQTKRLNSWLSQYSSNIEEALSRNVDCRIITPQTAGNQKNTDSQKMKEKFQNFQVRFIAELPNASFSIWDNKEILITTQHTDAPPFPATTLWSNNESLIDLCLGYFECLWQKAEKIDIAQH